MSEQLEQVKDQSEPVVVQAENTSPESVEQSPEVKENIPEWKKAIEESNLQLKREHEQAMKRLERGLGESIGKVRKKAGERIKALEEIVNRVVPDPSAMSFKSEDEKKAYEAYASPIRNEFKQKSQEFEQLEKQEAIEANRNKLLGETYNGLISLPNANEVLAKYTNAVNANPEYDFDDDILSFTSKSPSMLAPLYENPELITNIKKMNPSEKMATLSYLMVQSMTNAKAPVIAVPTAKVNQPATPPKGGGGGGQSPLSSAKTAQEYLEALRKRK